MTTEQRPFTFSVDNQLLSELGERLVSKNYVALAELIKNAYDADAKSVSVKLRTRDPSGGSIVIADVGHGMTADEVKKYWMRVATDHKVRRPFSERYGRPKTGSKGVGRFACRRLAKKLELTSVAKVGDEYEVTRMTFDWKAMRAGKDLDAEQFIAHVTREATGTPGVTLKLSGLNEHWTQRDFNILRRSLVDISIAGPEPRKGYQPDPGFEVRLESDQFKTAANLLSEQYLNAGWGRLTGSVSQGGHAELTLESKGSRTKTFVIPKIFAQCKDVTFDMSWIPGTSEYWRDPKIMTKGVRKQLEETEGGIKVYLDGFRVYPYGESGTDWLDISRMLARRAAGVNKLLEGIARKLDVDPTRALLDHPKETTLLGKALLPAGASKLFVIKMDREGFVENDAFLELKLLLQLSLQWMTVQYVYYKQTIAEAKVEEEAREILPDATTGSPQRGALSAALAVVERASSKGIQSVPGQNKTVSKAAEIIHRSVDAIEARISKLQILASTGPVVFAFAHEIKGVIARLATHANRVDKVVATLQGKHAAELRTIATDLRETRRLLDQQVALFGTLAKSLAEDKPARHAITDVATDVVNGFASLTETFGIEVDLGSIDPNARTQSMRSAEIYSLLINLVSNALKSCIAAKGKGIAISAARDTDGLFIRVLDTGVGLQQGYWKRVFEPLVSDPENKIYPQLDRLIDDESVRSLGRGSGLGLSIVRDIAVAHGGRVQFVEPPKHWRACVELRLP